MTIQLSLGKWKNRKGECVEIVHRLIAWADSNGQAYNDNGMVDRYNPSDLDIIAPWEEKPASESFWIVWMWNQAGAPTKKHESYESAANEAKRLAEKHPKTEFFVMQSCRKFWADVTVREL
jgi:hypothetical protein